MSEHEGWHEITVATPLPLGVAAALMRLIGTAWPESVIRPTERKQFGNEPVFTMLVPPTAPSEVAAEQAREIRIDSITDEFDAQFTGFRIDEEDHAWLSTAPPEELTLHLGQIGHRIFTEMGGINYVEWQVHTKNDDGPDAYYTLTISRRDGKTPHVLRQEAEAERDELRAAIMNIRDQWDGGDLASAVNEAVLLLPTTSEEDT